MNERDIQAALYDWRACVAPSPPMIPNVYFYQWESDLLYISRAGYVTEFEVKLTRSDFRADFKKVARHDRLKSGGPGRPKFFYYATPKGLVLPDEVPAYAGLIYIESSPYRKGWGVTPKYRARRVKKAPAARVEPIAPRDWQALFAKGTERYWNLLRRMNQEGTI